MVKKRTGGAKRYKAAAFAAVASSQGNAEGSTDGNTAGPASVPPKRVQTKIARKVAFLDKVSGSHKASLALGSKIGKKQRRKKQAKPLPDLSSLMGALEEVGQQQQKQSADGAAAGGGTGKAKPMGGGIKTNKGRAAVTIAETARLQQVLAHPLYKSNPILAITNHLGATLPPLPAKPVHRTAGSSKQKKGSGKGGRGRGDAMMQ